MCFVIPLLLGFLNCINQSYLLKYSSSIGLTNFLILVGPHEIWRKCCKAYIKIIWKNILQYFNKNIIYPVNLSNYLTRQCFCFKLCKILYFIIIIDDYFCILFIFINIILWNDKIVYPKYQIFSCYCAVKLKINLNLKQTSKF